MANVSIPYSSAEGTVKQGMRRRLVLINTPVYSISCKNISLTSTSPSSAIIYSGTMLHLEIKIGKNSQGLCFCFIINSIYIITLRIQALSLVESHDLLTQRTDARNYVTQNSLFCAANHNTASDLR